jgi:hypothetical protein
MWENVLLQGGSLVLPVTYGRQHQERNQNELTGLPYRAIVSLSEEDMPRDFQFSQVVDFARPVFQDFIPKLFFTRVRLLCVVDRSVQTDLSPDSFGIGRVIKLMRDTTVGCMYFDVDIAQRPDNLEPNFAVDNTPGDTGAKYTGFRFDSVHNGARVIDQYDEIWCFGFRPGNDGGPDSNIDNDLFKATEAELAALTQWMNDKKGGVFATGDHDYLGASMCRFIPRVGTMRAWTNTQGVPPINGTARIDTHRPATPGQASGADIIPSNAQEDVVPQPIEWVPWLSINIPWWRVRERPHPVLCHPTIGPIDVMPDHAHEGTVFDHVPNADTGLAAITLTNTLNFNGTNFGDEYPTKNGVQPLPQVIAHGRTLADPPLQQAKGDSPAKRFAMMSIYDGHRADIGRVAVDSTWHHWMNLNISDIEAAGGNNWEKIKRYFINLGVWLAPPQLPRHCLYIHALESFYQHPGIEELHRRTDLFVAGDLLRSKLIYLFGPCWVTHFVFDWLGQLDIKLRERLIERYLAVPLPGKPFPPRPDPCLTCPPFEMIETAVLGGMVRATAEVLKHDGDLAETLNALMEVQPETFEKVMLDGSAAGLKYLRDRYARSIEQTKALLG